MQEAPALEEARATEPVREDDPEEMRMQEISVGEAYDEAEEEYEEQDTEAPEEMEDDGAMEKEQEPYAQDAEEEGPVMDVYVNGETVRLTGKTEYIFVDIFDFIDFDLKASNGRAIVIKVNGEYTDYVRRLDEGDQIEIYWEEK